MKVTLEIKGDKAFSILNVLKSMKGVKVTSIQQEVKESKETYLKSLKEAVDEVNLAKQGKIKLKTLDELISEI